MLSQGSGNNKHFCFWGLLMVNFLSLKQKKSWLDLDLNLYFSASLFSWGFQRFPVHITNSSEVTKESYRH